MSPDPNPAPGLDEEFGPVPVLLPDTLFPMFELLPAQSPDAAATDLPSSLEEEVLVGPVVHVPRPDSAGLDLARYLADHGPARADDLAYLRTLAADIAEYARAAHAEGTRSKYGDGWADFARFCGRYRLSPGLPDRAADVEVIALYLADLARRQVSMSTLDGRIAAIRFYHLDHGHRSPTDHPHIRRQRRGIRRTHGAAADGKDAVSLPLLIAMLAHCEPGPPLHPVARPALRRGRLVKIRNRCLLLVGFFAGLRREELVSLYVDDLELVGQGLRITVGRSKTDQEGTGRRIDLPYAPPDLVKVCPVRATLAWLDACDRREHLRRSGKSADPRCPPLLSGVRSATRISTEPLQPQQVGRVVKETAAAAGQPPEVVEDLAAHSLRAGIATAAEAAGVPQELISRLLGHSTGTTGVYIRPAFDELLHQRVYRLLREHFARFLEVERRDQGSLEGV